MMSSTDRASDMQDISRREWTEQRKDVKQNNRARYVYGDGVRQSRCVGKEDTIVMI